jgi:spermidine synthase
MNRSVTEGTLAKVSTREADVALTSATVLAFYSLALCSGAAALIYQVAWARMLSLSFGSTTQAAAAVIASFMGGMGIGASLYYRIYRWLPRPVIVYAVLEFGIALSTALLTRVFYRLPGLYAEVSGVVGDGALGLTRFVSVFLLLLVPSALMGATFPALCTVMIHSARGVDRHLGRIYGINTIGAGVGAFLSGLVLVERLGLIGSVNVATAINLTVAVSALGLLRTALPRVQDLPTGTTAIRTFLPRSLTSIVLVVSGFSTLAYEILWFRAIRYVFGNTTYALTTVLAIFLAGLGVGALWLGRVVRRGAPERDLASIQCLIAALALLAMAGEWLVLSIPELRDQTSIFSDLVRLRPWWVRMLVNAGVAVAIMLPPALLMGLSFPLASRLYLGDVRKLGQRVGSAYLLANLGSIAGAVVAAAWLLPGLGAIGGTKLVAGLNLGLGLGLGVWIRRRVPGFATGALAAAMVFFALAVVLPATPRLYGEKLGLVESPVEGNQLFVREADQGTVQVLHEPGHHDRRVMAIDGNLVAWGSGYRNRSNYRKQVILAHLPMAIDPRIRHTLNVGLGSGATLAALADYPSVETLDCVEINPAVAEGARFFSESEVLKDPRVRLVIDDAVHYLLTSDKQYDLIISDGKQHPFFSGNATLLCREYYELALERMSAAGLFVQWIPVHSLGADFAVILHTMCDVFPYVDVFYYPEESTILVGARTTLARPHMTADHYRQSSGFADMSRYYLDNVDVLLACQTAGRRQLQKVLGAHPTSTWDHLRLDFTPYKAPQVDWERAKIENLELLLAAEAEPRPDTDPPLALEDTRYLASSRGLRRSYLHYFRGDLAGAYARVQEAVAANPADKYVQAAIRFYEMRGARAGRRPPT